MSLRIGAVDLPGSTSKCSFDSHCPARGFAVEVAFLACEFLKLNCTFQWYKEGKFGDANESGNGTGLIGAIQRNEFDASLPYICPTYLRSKAVSFSHSFYDEGIVLVTRMPDGSNGFDWAMFRAFQWPVFVAFVIALILISLLLTAAFLQQPRLKTYFLTFFANFVALVDKKHNPLATKLNSVRLLIAIWGLVAVVFSGAYTGRLFSDKIILNNQFPFIDLETFVTCLEENRCHLIMPTTSISYYLQLTAPGNDLSNRVNEAITNNPVIIEAEEKILSKIAQEKNQYLVWLWAKEEIWYNMNNDQCDYFIVDTPFKDANTFAVRKNSSILDDLSKTALLFRETGQDILLRRKYFRPVSCDNRGSSSRVEDGNGLYSVRTIFYFYVLGVVTGMMWFLVELALKKKIFG